MFNRYFFKNLDYVMIFVVMTIIVIGVTMIISTTGQHFSANAQKQVIAAVIGFFLMLVISAVDYSKLSGLVKPLYGIGIFMLIAVLIIGTVTKGAKSWINLGGFNMQPSEFVKIVLIVTMAFIMSSRKNPETVKDLVFPLAVYGFPVALILLQPDLGTALVFMGILAGMLFIGEIRYKYLFGMLGCGLVALPMFWQILKDYQKNRLLTFIDPALDPLGAGYNIIQSKIAIGSGYIWGKGLFHGTQINLNFLPEPHTDFIFSAIGEELGFAGSMLVLLLFFILVYRGIRIAVEAKDDFGKLMATGVVCMYTFHILLNVGGATGIMPLTGIPLPLVSYGGSSLVTNLAALGILQSVHIRRKELIF